MRASVDRGLCNVTGSSGTVTDHSEIERLSRRRKPLQQTLHAKEAPCHRSLWQTWMQLPSAKCKARCTDADLHQPAHGRLMLNFKAVSSAGMLAHTV